MNVIQIVKITIIALFLAVFSIACTQKKLEVDENNYIFFHYKKNHGKSIRDKLVLTPENIQNVIQFVTTNYSNSPLTEQKYEFDDASVERYVDDLNKNGFRLCSIYISGIPKYAGYSSVLAWLNGYLDIDEPTVHSFHFFIDEEYFDTSGIAFSDYFLETENSETLHLYKLVYEDSGNYKWIVTWPMDDDEEKDYEASQLLTKEEKIEILTSFLMRLRDTKVFPNIDLEWFGSVYTGVDNRQRIRDLL